MSPYYRQKSIRIFPLPNNASRIAGQALPRLKLGHNMVVNPTWQFQNGFGYNYESIKTIFTFNTVGIYGKLRKHLMYIIMGKERGHVLFILSRKQLKKSLLHLPFEPLYNIYRPSIFTLQSLDRLLRLNSFLGPCLQSLCDPSHFSAYLQKGRFLSF